MLLFSWNTYSTPLFIGFMQGSLYAGLLGVRAWREQRLSDALLSALLIGLCLELMDYMLGFAGVEILWQELDFFPRDIGLLLGPLSLGYLHSQTNRNFRITTRQLWHALPLGLVAGYHLVVFAQGPAFVREWQASVHLPLYLEHVETLLEVGSHLTYIVACFRHYSRYRSWLPTHLSDLDTARFTWFRNYLVAITVATGSAWGMTLLTELFELSYWQDWWDELLLVGIIYYLAITGYHQPQELRGLQFDEPPETAETLARVERPATASSAIDPDAVEALRGYLATAQPYLDPQLSLSDLAQRMGWPPSRLSEVINSGMGRPFSELINQYRIAEFQRRAAQPESDKLSLLGVALDCGFNSKATFNRVFKKEVGTSPSEWRGQARGLLNTKAPREEPS